MDTNQVYVRVDDENRDFYYSLLLYNTFLFSQE